MSILKFLLFLILGFEDRTLIGSDCTNSWSLLIFHFLIKYYMLQVITYLSLFDKILHVTGHYLSFTF